MSDQCLRPGTNKATKFAHCLGRTELESLAQRMKTARMCALYEAYNGDSEWKDIRDRLHAPSYLSRVEHKWKISCTGHDFSRKLGLPDFNTIRTWRWEVCQPYTPAAIIPQKVFLLLISVRGWEPGRIISFKLFLLIVRTFPKSYALPTIYWNKKSILYLLNRASSW